jgi:hypothetical protein
MSDYSDLCDEILKPTKPTNTLKQGTTEPKSASDEDVTERHIDQMTAAIFDYSELSIRIRRDPSDTKVMRFEALATIDTPEAVGKVLVGSSGDTPLQAIISLYEAMEDLDQ